MVYVLLALMAEEPANLVAFAAPKRPNRKAWKEKAATGRTRTGREIPPPASKKEAQAYVTELAKEATQMVVTGKELPLAWKEKFDRMSSKTRAHILSYLGEDVEQARSVFASELLANAKLVASHIMENFTEYPPSVQSFIFTAFVDKSELLRQKSAVTASVANVNQQIIVYGDGQTDKAKLIAELTGAAFGLTQPEKPIEVAVAANG